VLKPKAVKRDKLFQQKEDKFVQRVLALRHYICDEGYKQNLKITPDELEKMQLQFVDDIPHWQSVIDAILLVATKYGDTAACEWLIKHGAKIIKNDDPLYCSSATCGAPKMRKSSRR